MLARSIFFAPILDVSCILNILRDPSPISHRYSVIFWRQLFYALYCCISPLGKDYVGHILADIHSSAGEMLFYI